MTLEEWGKFRSKHDIEVDAHGYAPRFFSNMRCAIRTAHHLAHYGEGDDKLKKRIQVRVISRFETLSNADIDAQYSQLRYEKPEEERMAS